MDLVWTKECGFLDVENVLSEIVFLAGTFWLVYDRVEYLLVRVFWNGKGLIESRKRCVCEKG